MKKKFKIIDASSGEKLKLGEGKRMSYNEKIYSDWVQYYIPAISQQDLTWLCNKAANIYRNLNDGCIDNFRCCAGESMSQAYKDAYDNGCCGFSDTIVHNLLTGNVFMIGFNYGH